MKFKTLSLLTATAFLFSCNARSTTDSTPGIHLNGTWQLISGTTITKGVSVDYPKGPRMVKIINDTNFAFLKHDINSQKDSVNHFDAGGGSYTLAGDQYTEHLDYYADKNWEGKTFKFTVSIKGDTLIQKGIEKVEKAGIDRVIIEKYLKVKN